LTLLATQISFGQRVQGTIKPATQPNEVIVSIRPTAAFTAQMTVLNVSIQVPISVGARPSVTFANLQPTLFSTYVQQDEDQGDSYYTWGFNCAVPGGSNLPTTNWSTSEIDVLRINFGGVPSTSQVRVCHYLDGGTNGFAIFYVETNLSAVNGGVLSDWGNLFYTPGAVNGAPAPGNIGVPNADYSFGPVSGITLPVKFSGFSAFKDNNNGILNWSVENQTATSSHFEVERSLDGRNFSKIGRKDVVLNAGGLGLYDFTDAGVFDNHNGNVYYRIKQIDRNGEFVYSPVRTLKPDGKGFGLSMFPNPVEKETTLSFTMDVAKPVTIVLTDATGKRITEYPVQAQKGLNTKKINVSALTAGAYMFIIRTEDESQTLSFVKGN
jgi:hypothetical protein